MQAHLRCERARFLQRGGVARGLGGLREDEQVERLALVRDIAARQGQGTRRIALDREREHRLLATVRDLGVRAQVGQRDALAHLGRVARGLGALGQLAGDGQAQQHRIAADLAGQPLQGFRRAPLFDQEVGIREPRIAVGLQFERGPERRIGGLDAAGALLHLGPRDEQPGLRRSRQSGGREKACERCARRVELAAQRGVLGRARARIQRRSGVGELAAGGIRIGIAALHAAHRGKREPGLRDARAARPCDQALQVLHRGIELVQILLKVGTQQQHIVGRVGIRPARDRGQCLAREARIAVVVGTRQQAACDADGQGRIGRPLRKCAARSAFFEPAHRKAGQHLDHLVVTRRHDRFGMHADDAASDQQRAESDRSHESHAGIVGLK